MSSFLVPETIKQQFIPYVLLPKFGSGPPSKFQFFSFKQSYGKDYTSSTERICGTSAMLNICPSSIYQHFKNDIANKLLYDSSVTYENISDKDTVSNLTFESILNELPGIQIREYTPNARLNQVLELFVTTINGIFGLFSSNNDSNSKDELPLKYQFGRVWDTIKYTYNQFISNLQEIPNFPSKDDFCVNDNYKNLVMNFPYTLYYLLQSCYTTNIYEIPGITTTKDLYSSNGSAGWLDANSQLSLGKIGIINNIPIIGKLLDFALGNIGIDYMPWWKADSGSSTREPEITVEFDLFNDTLDASIVNFIYVNTLIPNNRWLQYGIIRHSSSLYDVRLEGYNRLFACTGDFNVTYKGVLRSPSFKFYSKLFKTHLNTCQIDEKWTEDENINNLWLNSFIRIPDIYHIKMTFKSLLPANFNNYIFSISNNTSNLFNEVDERGQTTGGEVDNCVKAFFDQINNIMNDGKNYYNTTARQNMKNQYTIDKYWNLDTNAANANSTV